MPEATPPPRRRRSATPAADPAPSVVEAVDGTAADGPSAVAVASAGAVTPRTILTVGRVGLNDVAADVVRVQLGGIGTAHAEQVSVAAGGIGAARADRVDVRFGSVGAGLAGELHVSQGSAGVVVAREATVAQGFVRTLVARDVTITRPSAVMLLIAARVSGDVRPLLDWRGALAAGLGFGIVTGLVRAVTRRS